MGCIFFRIFLLYLSISLGFSRVFTLCCGCLYIRYSLLFKNLKKTMVFPLQLQPPRSCIFRMPIRTKPDSYWQTILSRRSWFLLLLFVYFVVAFVFFFVLFCGCGGYLIVLLCCRCRQTADSLGFTLNFESRLGKINNSNIYWNFRICFCVFAIKLS